MMNGLALFLVISSLAAGGKWSPYPDQKDPEEVIVKEGTRVVVVEYDKEGPGNTKVSISPQEADHVIFQKVIEGKDKFKEKVMEASEVLPNMGLGLSRGQHHHPQNGQNPKDLLSDAFDKCKEKIAAKICRSEERVSEKAHESQECAKETYSKTKEKVSEKAHDIQEEAKNAYTNTKEKVPEKTHKFQEGVKDAVKKAKDAAKSSYDVGKTIVEDIAGNASKIESGLRNQMMKTVKGEEDENKDGGDTVKSTLREFQEQLHHDLVKRGYDTVLSASATRPLMCVIHILGFATAYGVCVWITFFSSFVLAGALPNQQFAVVQSKIYPFYFKTMALCVGLALLGHVMSQGEKVVYRRFHICQGYALLATLVMVLINLLYLEPRATKVLALLLNLYSSSAFCLHILYVGRETMTLLIAYSFLELFLENKEINTFWFRFLLFLSEKHRKQSLNNLGTPKLQI